MRRGMVVALVVGMLLALAACGENSKIEGRVVHGLSGKPLKGIRVAATASVNVKEDEKFASLETETDGSGEFRLTGLSPRYQYKLQFLRPGLAPYEVWATPPDKRKTLEIKPDVRLFPFDLSNLSIWRDGELRNLGDEGLTNMAVVDSNLHGPLAVAYLSIFLPTATGADKAVRAELKTGGYGMKATDPVEGSLHAPRPQTMPEVKRFKRDSFLMVSKEYAAFSVFPLHWFPGMEFRDETGQYPGDYCLPEGYYLCYNRFVARGQCCVHLDLDFETAEPREMRNLVTGESIRHTFLDLSRLAEPPGVLYALCPSDIYMGTGANRYLKTMGVVPPKWVLPVLVFTVE